MTMFAITLGLCLISVAFAQVPGLGGCPDAKTIPNFDVAQYAGKWYEQNRFFAIFEIGAKCVTAEYTPNANGTVKVVNSQISSITGSPSSIEGSAEITNPDEPGKLKVKFPSSPVDGSYWILGTDYTDYAAVWSCQNFVIFNTQFAWILTRQQNASNATIQKAKEVFERNGVNVDLFEKTNQVDCSSE